MANTTTSVSQGLDSRFASEQGLYGSLDNIPLVAQKGHYRRMELLDSLSIGNVADKVCVDFGTGSWGFAGIYPKLHHCKFAYGLDISTKAIELSRKLSTDCNFPYGENFNYLQSDGMDLPLPDGSVDIIFAGESIEHVRVPMRFLSECHRLLKPDGQLIITTPNRDAMLYKLQNDQYCVSPEHFWLFNLEELKTVVSEFFDIAESCGFNGSIHRDLDKTCTDNDSVEQWAKLFADEPQLATGLILRAVRKPLPTRREYLVRYVAPEEVFVSGFCQRLVLEFGLQGIMIDSKDSKIEFSCPPCGNLVIHLWTHAWSGYARVQCNDTVGDYNLFSHDPGWLPIHLELNSDRPSRIQISTTGQKDDRSQSAQVIFFEACVYD